MVNVTVVNIDNRKYIYIVSLLSPLMYVVAGDRPTVTGEQWPVAASFKYTFVRANRYSR